MKSEDIICTFVKEGHRSILASDYTAGDIKNGSFSAHSFNQHYLSIPQYTGSWGNRFQETHCIRKDDILVIA